MDICVNIFDFITSVRCRDFCDFDVTCFRRTEWNAVKNWRQFVYSLLVVVCVKKLIKYKKMSHVKTET